MTEKELLYIEDLLGAEELAYKVCNCRSKEIKDDDLKTHFENLACKHNENISKLLDILK